MDAAALAGLPEPVRRYFAACGFLDRPAMRTARLTWDAFEMRLAKGKDWTPVRVRQFNRVDEPARLAKAEYDVEAP
jgi:hypothetical protein